MDILGYKFRKPRVYGWRIELIALLRVFYPRANNNSTTKLISLVFVTGWVIITIGMTFEDLPTARPIYYGIYTALVFIMIGRIWHIEVEKFISAEKK